MKVITEMRNKKILVTGGAGFIGSEFVRMYNEFFKKIYILDSLTYAGKLARLKKVLDNQNVEFIQLDINESHKLKHIFSNLDFIVHFAAESHVDRSIDQGHPFVKSNISGTYNILEEARKYPKIRTLVVSTDEVYGSISFGEVDENGILNPSSVYSASKAAADLLALAQHHTHKQDILITRSCNNYGPYQDLEKFIPNSIKAIMGQSQVTIYGDGKNIREWIHVRDHCSAIYKILVNGESGRIYNIGTGERFTNIEVVNMLYEIQGIKAPEYLFVADRKGHDFRYALNSSKLRNEIDWVPTIKFKDGLYELFTNATRYELDLD